MHAVTGLEEKWWRVTPEAEKWLDCPFKIFFFISQK